MLAIIILVITVGLVWAISSILAWLCSSLLVKLIIVGIVLFFIHKHWGDIEPTFEILFKRGAIFSRLFGGKDAD